jgi:gluconate kinase
VLVVMGVAGSGKSVLARVLAARLGWRSAEGDDFHPSGNVAKMATGQALTDTDRSPWLARVREWIDSRIAAGAPRELLLARLAARTGHFMPATLLDSQFADLEPPGPDEQAITLDATEPADGLATLVTQMIKAASADSTDPSV